MLESRSELAVISVGTRVADLIGIIRINIGMIRKIFSVMQNNKYKSLFLIRIFRDCLIEGFRRKSMSAVPSLFFLSLIYGDLEKGWISNTKYWTKFHRAWGGEIRRVSDMKTLTRLLTQSSRLPDVGYLVDGILYDLDWHKVNKHEFIEKNRNINFVVKRNLSERGNHVTFLSAKDFLEANLSKFDDSVIQREIIQLESLNQISNDNRVTIRILTGYSSESKNASVLSMFLKYPDPVNQKDFARVPISQDSLKLTDYFYDGSYRKISLPSAFKDSDYFSEQFNETQKIALSHHIKFPHFKVIGWDFGIDSQGTPWIFEWNADHPSIEFHQALYGAIFVEHQIVSMADVG
jgi:hypothetical protein